MLDTLLHPGAEADTSSGPTFSSGKIDPRLNDLGQLIGLLQQISGTVESGQTGVNFSWFASPLTELAQFSEKAEPLIDLLHRLLSQLGEPQSIDGKSGDAWYSIKYQGEDTCFYVVLPEQTAPANNQISLGFAFTWETDGGAIGVYARIPVFVVPNKPLDVFQLGATAAPIEVHFEALDDIGDQQSGTRLTARFTFHDNPTFEIELSTGGAVTAKYESVQSLLADDAATQILNATLALDIVQVYLGFELGDTSATPGSILGPEAQGGLGLLAVDADGTYTLADLHAFEGKSSIALAQKFVRVVLNAMANSAAPLIPVGYEGAGLYVVKEPNAHGGHDYGFTVQLPPIALPVSSPGSDPGITLQIGSWLLNEEPRSPTNPTWWERASSDGAAPPTPGIALYLLSDDAQSNLSFTGVLELVSVGFDVAPPANRALVEVGSVVMHDVEVRGYAKLDFLADEVVAGKGGVLLCHGVGIPLGSSFGSASGVAQSLIASGGNNDPQSAQTLNPTYSIAAAFLHPGTKHYSVQLYDAQGNPNVDVLFPLQRSFGPLYLRSVDVGWQQAQDKLKLGLDAGLALGPLAVELVDLDIGVPANSALDPSTYSVDLHGLNVSFNSAPVSLEAGLIEHDGEYLGEAMLQISEYSIGAFGAFGTTAGQPSLFVFAWTGEPMGGPPYFYVHALAAGFGYNRGLNLPGIEGVSTFPFVAALSDPNAFGSGTRQQQAANALLQLVNNNVVPMRRGTYWLAAGVAFKSFEVVDSSALVSIEFGSDLSIGLLGKSTLQLPKESSNPFVYAELALLVSFKPAAGTFLAQGQLTPNSWVLTPACHLTGGFAFQSWWQEPHEGEFVLTVGGYHPLFAPPTYYPVVPRLGFTWNVSDNITIQGGAYFALTPSCAMGGGELQAVYQSGNLRAWFHAQADALIRWKPFFFDVMISVSIGVSYKIHLLFVSTTLTVELGAGLNVYGPPTGGVVYVNWYIISFSIPFGAPRSSDAPLGWNEFVGQLLPNRAASQVHAHLLGDAAVQPRIDVALTGGQISQDDQKNWTVRSDGLAFNVRTTVPHTAGSFSVAGSQLPVAISGYEMGIVPMAAASVETSLKVDLVAKSGAINGKFTPQLLVQNLPLAIWGKQLSNPGAPTSESVALPVGFTVAADPYQAVGVPVIKLQTLAYDTIDPKPGLLLARVRRLRMVAVVPPVTLPIVAVAPLTPASAAQNDGSLAVIQSTLAHTETLRTAIVGALDDFGFGTGLTGAPAGLASNLSANLRAPVMLGSPAGVVWPDLAMRRSA